MEQPGLISPTPNFDGTQDSPVLAQAVAGPNPALPSRNSPPLLSLILVLSDPPHQAGGAVPPATPYACPMVRLGSGGRA